MINQAKNHDIIMAKIFFVKSIFKKIYLIIFYMHRHFTCMYVCVPVSVGARRRNE